MVVEKKQFSSGLSNSLSQLQLSQSILRWVSTSPMSYLFEIPREKDITLNVSSDTTFSLKFEHLSSFFALIEDLQILESVLLQNMGYGQSIEGPTNQ